MQWVSRVDSGTGKYARALLKGLPNTDGYAKAIKPKFGYQGSTEVLGDRGIEIKNKNGKHGGWMPTPEGY